MKNLPNLLDWKRTSWMDLLLAALSIILLSLAYPTPDLGLFAWIALVPWLLVIGSRDSPPLLISFLVGAIFFTYNGYWLGYVTYPGWLGLSLYQALYFLLFGLACNYLYRTLQLPLFLIAPFLWVAQEYLRSFVLTGFPWFFIAHTQYSYLPIIQVSEITGAYGVSFVVVSINACFAQGILNWKIGKNVHAPFTLAFIIFLVPLSYGVFRLAGLKFEEGPRLCLVQGNIPQYLKMDESEEQRAKNLQKYLHLSEEVKRGSVDLLVWPETMAPGLLNIDPRLTGRKIDILVQTSLTNLAQKLDAHLLVGGISIALDRDDTFYNSAFFYNPQGILQDRYDKLHLVPFGEYTPLKEYFPFLRKMVPYQIGLSPGNRWSIFTLKTQNQREFKFAVLICYEDTVPHLVRRFKDSGADFLINITNDGWFGNSAELDQHLAIMVFRAVENRTGIVRAANTGISSFVAPSGDVYLLLHQEDKRREIEGILEGKILLSAGPKSWYTTHGDIFAQACLAISLGLVLGIIYRRFYP